MKKYKVTFYYNTYVTIEVEADGKTDAIEEASLKMSNQNNLEELLDNLCDTEEVDVNLIMED